MCTKKHTTILDFLDHIENTNLSSYSNIILHLGIVDYSPRPQSQFSLVYETKNKLAQKLFPKETMHPQFYDNLYEDEKTFSLYNLDFLNNVILKRLTQISKQTKIIWVGVNKVDTNWDGNYVKKRPSNINEILTYQNEILKYLNNNETNIKYIEIDKIKEFNLRKHTLDNMHLSNDGFRLLFKILLNALV